MNTSASRNLYGGGKRSSNFELYRIICMVMIVAHHYVALSGLLAQNGPMSLAPLSAKSLYLNLFGMWGKTGINCFLMITGYFMCTSSISIRKFLKLYLEVVFYGILLALFFAIIGFQDLSIKHIQVFLPFRIIHSDSFVSAFLMWWLFIPFLNILINNCSIRQHQILICLLVLIFSIYPTIPRFLLVDNNPICWFSTIYAISSYIRKYPESIYKSNSACFWGVISIICIIISISSVILLLHVQVLLNIKISQFYLVADSFKPLSLLVAVSTFMFFRNINIRYNKFINILGGASFAVLLIHSGSYAMIDWLWNDVVDCVGNYNLPFIRLVLYSSVIVIAIYLVCTLIDYLRLKFFEEPFFRWYDKKNRLTKLQSIFKL